MRSIFGRSGIASGFGRKRGGAAPPAFSIPAGAWTVTEAPADADTRRVIVTVDKSLLPAAIPSGKAVFAYRGAETNATPTTGASAWVRLTDVGTTLTWQASGRTDNNRGHDYVRLVLGDASLSTLPWDAAVEAVSSVQIFYASRRTEIPEIASRGADGAGGGRVVFADPVAQDAANPLRLQRTVDQRRHRINGGADVVVTTDLTELTFSGMSGSFTLEVEWHNANGWSETLTAVIQVDLPGYGTGDWTLTDAVAPDGDGLFVDISANPTPLEGSVLLGTQMRFNPGSAGYGSALVYNTLLTTTALTSTAVQIRAVYDVGYSPWSEAKTVMPTEPVIVPPVAASRVGSPINSGGTTDGSFNRSFTDVTGLSEGQCVCWIVSVREAVSLASYTAGWTLISSPTPGNTRGLYIFVRWAEAGQSSLPFSMTFSGTTTVVGQAFVVNGTRHVVAGAIEHVSSGAPNAPVAPTSPLSADEPLYAITAANCSANYAEQTSAPSGWGNYWSHRTGSGSSSSDIKMTTADLTVTAMAVDAPAWPASSATTHEAQTVVFLPGVKSFAPVFSVPVSHEAVAAEGELILADRGAVNALPSPSVTFTIDRTSDGGSTFTVVATLSGQNGHYQMEAGYQYRARAVATNEAGTTTSASAWTAVTSASPGLLPVQTITQGDVTIEVAGLKAWGWTEDGVFCGVPAATNYAILSCTPPMQLDANGLWINGHEKNPYINGRRQGFDERNMGFDSGNNPVTNRNSDFRLDLVPVFPIRLNGGDTWQKSVGRDFGNRSGQHKQWFGAFVAAAAPVADQIAPCITQFSGRDPNMLTIPVAAFLASLPSLAGSASPYSVATALAQLDRFDPSHGRFVGASGNASYERFALQDSGLDGSSNYSQWQSQTQVIAAFGILIAGWMNPTQRRRALIALASRGRQWDTGVTQVADGGHGQHPHLPIMLARYFAGLPRDLGEAEARIGGFRTQVFPWTTEALAALVPGPDAPIRQLRPREVMSITPGTDSFTIRCAKATSEKAGLPLTNTRIFKFGGGAGGIVSNGGIGHNSSLAYFDVVVPTLPSGLVVGDSVYFDLSVAFTAGMPEWSIREDEDGEPLGYNSSNLAKYRDICEYHFTMLILCAFGIWPRTGRYAVAMDYAERVVAGYPTNGAFRHPIGYEISTLAYLWANHWAAAKAIPER